MSRFNTVQHGSSRISKVVHGAATVLTRFITVYLGSSNRDEPAPLTGTVRTGLNMCCVFFYNGNTQRLTESCFLIEKPGIEPATPGLQGIALIHYTTGASPKKTFCGFSMGRNQYWAGRVYDLCVYYITGTPEGSTESGFMEKPGIETATPGLQGIALIP